MVMFLQQNDIDKLCYDREYGFINIFSIEQVMYVKQVGIQSKGQQYDVNLCDMKYFVFNVY